MYVTIVTDWEPSRIHRSNEFNKAIDSYNYLRNLYGEAIIHTSLSYTHKLSLPHIVLGGSVYELSLITSESCRPIIANFAIV